MRAEHFIDGEWVRPASGRTFVTIDPSTEEPICEVGRGDAADIDRAVRAADRAMHGPWAELAPAERGSLLCKLAAAIGEAKEEIARLETVDVGKPLKESRGDVDGVVATLVYNAGAADKMEGATIPLGPGFIDFTMMEPVGVTAHIVPWNFPLGMAIRSLAPALAAGCTAVLKPAEQSPLSALKLAEIAEAVGLPKGVINVVTGYGEEAGEALTRHPLVRSISFTGSVETGRRIMAAAASGPKPVVLELGGKNALLVFEDADLDRLAEDMADAAFGNSGQVCSACSRILVAPRIAQEIGERLAARAARITVGPGLEDRDIGPLVSDEQHTKVMDHIEDARRAGGRLLVGGGRPVHLRRGFFVEPTVFADVDPGWRIAREEVFGPVLAITAFDREEDALSIANSLGYGLVAGIYTRDISRALKLARRLETGSVWINGWFIGGQQAPTGGIKDSGIGRERGLPGVRNYLQIKNVGIRL
ncbi:MAG: aldehyde dehydrogenase family protein [Methylobacteriaceae bacterium]|nr:aldehyde dehydrogenase family protein [Methylobacteriaceae bacterium]